MSIRVFIVGVAFLIVLGTRGFAERSAEELQDQALTSIKRAEFVVAYANKLIEVKPDRESVEMYIKLYLEASRLYGDGARLLKALGPYYVQQEIIDKFSQAERDCLRTVDQARRLLNQGTLIQNQKADMTALINALKKLSP